MGKVVNFPSDGGEEREGVRKLSQEEFLKLIDPLREGLRRLYPTQVRDVLGVVGFGEKNGKECFVAGLLAWAHMKQPQPVVSTFLATFIEDRLDKISFLEAKNNYWDWKLMIETYQTRFNTKALFEELQRLREELTSGNLPF